MRPHAPGYFLYVAIAKFVYLFIHDIRLSLVGVSISSSVLTIVMLYLLTSKMYDRSSGIISALVLLSSPLFWFNSEMPFTYALEGLLSVTFAYACYKTINDEKNWWIASAVIIGLATGVRQHIIIMFLPLWLYSIRRCSFKQILTSFFIFGVTCLTWVIPMITLTGGLKKYFAAVGFA
jgi:4-amino-4-deoxy-L-arabinose transferase-like glycosyltransferase